MNNATLMNDPALCCYQEDLIALSTLRHPHEIRIRCHEVLQFVEQNGSEYFDIHSDRLEDVASLVATVTIQRYPDGNVPGHSRWRHFELDGLDRWGSLAENLHGDERARTALDLIIPSVLLDAGAWMQWGYTEPQTGFRYFRSEGLAIASFEIFRNGGFSVRPDADPLRTDAEALMKIDADTLAAHFQVSNNNPLNGLEGRAHMLRSLGEVIVARSDLFDGSQRLGSIYDYIRSKYEQPTAVDIFQTVLELLQPIWPNRIVMHEESLGDVWRHSNIQRTNASDKLVPFHKLSQWLTYSMLEPLQEAGVEVSSVDQLTGLAEYRNAGLMLDGGVLSLKDSRICENTYAPESELIVEWRALTVALLDKLLPLVQKQLNNNDLSLASMLEGGTWFAGRMIAKQKRPDGDPPIRLQLDGTVF